MTSLKRLHSLVAILILTFAPAAAQAAATPWVGDARGSARLITATEATGATTRLNAAIEFRLSPGWHTYWRTPGDAGFPAAVDWTGSNNLESAVIAWPAPHRLAIEGLENYVYKSVVTLPVTFTLKAPGKPLHLQAELDYANCEKICIPYHASFSLGLPAGLALPGSEAPIIAAAAAKIPGDLKAVALALNSVTVAHAGPDATLNVTLLNQAASLRNPDIFIEGIPNYAAPAPRVTTDALARTTTLSVPLPAEAAAAIAGRPLTFTLADGKRAAEFTATPVIGLATVPLASSLLAIVGVALLGGLILNAMPCVLPVLSFKLLSVASYAGAERRHVRFGLLATSSGILASFIALAAVLIGLKVAGAAVGWGIQFQQPWFLAAMAAAMTLFAASLLGLLPIPIPGFALAAGNLRARHALPDAFIAGAVATLLATSCSAPFVGTAVGFALARGPAEIFLVFAALGLGMAAPLLAVAVAPGLVRILPRPGPWMIVLRRILGLALAATAVWLLWVLAQLTSSGVAIAAAILLAALLATLCVRPRLPARARRLAAAAIPALVAAAILGPALAPQPLAQPPRTSGHDLWQPLDAAAIRHEVDNGRLVFVDVTAAWCLTCKVNESAVLDRKPVVDKLRQPGLTAMRADWTRPEPAVTAYLQSFGRYGVPLNVVFGPGSPTGEPLPELLTTEAVLQAFSRAAGPKR